jgi:perosamine synthetase
MSAVSFPKPMAPLFPVLGSLTMIPVSGNCPPSIVQEGAVLPVTTGRMGLSLALEHMRIRAGEKVLVPAYHCNSMVEPIVHASAEPVFYRVREDTAVDLDDVKARLDGRTRALMVTHYFGFPQNLSELRAFCDDHRLVLIEDCAHAFFGSHAGRPLGSYGDYAFVSPMKFFPLYDGGYLLSHRHRVDRIPTRSPGFLFSLKGARTILARSVHYRRGGPLRVLLAAPLWLRSTLRGRPASAPGEILEPVVQRPRYAFDGYFSGLAGEFDAEWIHTRMSTVSQAILGMSAESRVYVRRRANYVKLLGALRGLPGGRPLYLDLPDSVAPYVFPFLADDPARVFPALKREGVPISRFGEYLWEGFDRSICPTAVEFSRRVLQFPCHQELTEGELSWMIRTIGSVLTAAD